MSKKDKGAKTKGIILDMQRIEELAKRLMEGKYGDGTNEKAEKYLHGKRVASLAIKLRKHIFPDDRAHDDILTVAAWFHDVSHGSENHWALGAIKAREALSPYCNSGELDRICEIIAVHDDRSFEQDYSRQIKLHQDADHLDHFGVCDVWRSFIYAIPHDQTILDILDYMKNTRPKLNEKHRSELNFEISKRIFDEKMDFLTKFTKRFEVEYTGGIWGEENLSAK